MSTQTTIQWTDVTDNIIVVKGGGWWCRMISEGCVNCYAANLNQSDYFGGNHLPYSGEPPELILRTDLIDGWAKQRNPKRHFVASMTDVFGEWVKREWIFAMLDGMRAAPKQTFQVLTKRTDVALMQTNAWLNARSLDCLPENIWIGVSVENQRRADERIPLLLQISSKVRFLSIEPILGHIDLSHFGRIDWAIVGGESGPEARPCNVGWIRSIIHQCETYKTPCFVKQFGAVVVTNERTSSNWPPGIEFETLGRAEISTVHLKHKKGGDPSEWPEDLRVRQFPNL